MKIQIEPINIRFNLQATEVQLRQGGYLLGSNESCKVKVLFFSEGNLIDDSQVVEIPAEIVNNWENDEPLIDYVFSELNLVKIKSK
jgi:hypothetical protein